MYRFHKVLSSLNTKLILIMYGVIATPMVLLILASMINENIQFLVNNSDKLTGIYTTQLPSTTIRMEIADVAIIPIICAYSLSKNISLKALPWAPLRNKRKEGLF